MKLEFRKSFERDLKKVKDSRLLKRIKLVIEEVEKADNLQQVNNFKSLKRAFNCCRIVSHFYS